MTAPSDSTCPIGKNCCRLPLLLGLVLLAMLVFRPFGPRRSELEKLSDSRRSVNPAVHADANEKVSLKLDFGDGRQQEFSAIAWRNGMTVADLFQEVQGVTVKQEGVGAAAFLTGINGIRNEGAGGKNWLYEINGQTGDRSFAVCEIRPGDQVLWTFRASR